MPFDQLPQPILDPSVRNLPPRDRLITLRDWLYAGGPGREAWDYDQWFETETKCGTVGCAGGWYEFLTSAPADEDYNYDFYAEEFGIDREQVEMIFERSAEIQRPDTDWRNRSWVGPRDVANTIDLVLHDLV